MAYATCDMRCRGGMVKYMPVDNNPGDDVADNKGSDHDSNLQLRLGLGLGLGLELGLRLGLGLE